MRSNTQRSCSCPGRRGPQNAAGRPRPGLGGRRKPRSGTVRRGRREVPPGTAGPGLLFLGRKVVTATPEVFQGTDALVVLYVNTHDNGNTHLNPQPSQRLPVSAAHGAGVSLHPDFCELPWPIRVLAPLRLRTQSPSPHGTPGSHSRSVGGGMRTIKYLPLPFLELRRDQSYNLNRKCLQRGLK